MRYMVTAFTLAGFLAVSGIAATASADTMQNCAANWKAMSAADKAKTTYKAYSASCLKGGGATAAAAPAAAPAAKPAVMTAPAKPAMTAPAKPAAMATPASTGAAPAGATGQCKDGTFTMSKTHSGACSRHGGVAKWL